MTRFRNITLGGEYAISYPIGALTLPILILTVPLTSKVEGSNGTFLNWTIAAIIGTFVAILLLLFIDRSLWANRRIKPVKNQYLFLVGGIIGAAKGIVTEISAHYFLNINGISLATVAERSFSSASIGTISIPLIALMNFSWNANKAIRRKRISEIAGIDNLLAGVEDEVKEKDFLEDAKLRIIAAKNDFVNQYVVSTERNPSEIANKLNLIASELVRPLSHDAEKVHQKSILERHSWKESISRFPSAVGLGQSWLVALFVSSSARIQLQIRGLTGGLTILAVSTIIFYGVLKLFVSINKGSHRSIRRILTSFVLLMFINSSGSWVASKIFFGDYKVSYLINVFWCALITIAVGISALYLTYEMEELAELDEEYSNKYQELLKLEQGQPRIAASLARYLHGTMQTRLIASAYRIKNLEIGVDAKRLEEELRNVLAHFDLPLNLEQSHSGQNSKELVDEILELWSPFLEISIKFNDLANTKVEIVSSICEVINEALSNAFRHGNATKVCIEIESRGDQLSLEIADNGSNYHEAAPGLGMSIYDRLATNWSLSREGSSTVLKVAIHC